VYRATSALIGSENSADQAWALLSRGFIGSVAVGEEVDGVGGEKSVRLPPIAPGDSVKTVPSDQVPARVGRERHRGSLSTVLSGRH
jgi:hypothetical protein